jgi:CBS domain-containing protein
MQSDSLHDRLVKQLQEPVTESGRTDITVRDVMTDGDHVVAVPPDTTLKRVAELMMEHSISGLPIVDADHRVLGVVSEGDIVTGEAGGAGRDAMITRARALADPSAIAIPRTAGEAMSAPAVTILPQESVTAAARRITDREVNRLPVVDVDGRLVGIVARADIVAAFARTDGEIADNVREVLERSLGVGPDAVQVAVVDGEVRLSGAVDSEMTAKLAAFFASGLPGVVNVRSEVQASDGAEGPPAIPGERPQSDLDERV